MDSQKDNKQSQIATEYNANSLINNQSQNIISENTNQQTIRPVIPPLGPDKGSPANIFNPVDNNKVQKKGSKTFLFCCCGFSAILALIIIILVLLSLFTDINIPIISSLVGKLNKDPQNEAELAAKNLVGTVIGMLSPVAEAKESLVSKFVKSEISQDFLKEQINNYKEIESIRFESVLKLDNLEGYLDSSPDSMIDTSANINGAINYKEENDQKYEIELDASYKTVKKEDNYKGKLKVFGNITYILISQLSGSYSKFNEYIKDQWFKAEQAATLDLIISEYKTEAKDIEEENIEKLLEFITDDSVTKNAKFVEDENIKENKCYCINLSWNNDEFKEVLKTYSEIYDKEYNEAQVNESFKNIGKVAADICIDKNSSNIHKFSMIWEGKTEDIGELLNISLVLWDYNEDIQIDVPEDSIIIEELFENLY